MNTYVITVHIELSGVWPVCSEPARCTQYVYRTKARCHSTAQLTAAVQNAKDTAGFAASAAGHILSVTDVSVIKED